MSRTELLFTARYVCVRALNNLKHLRWIFVCAELRMSFAHLCQLAHTHTHTHHRRNRRIIFIFVSPDLFFRLKWIVMLNDNV